MRPVCAEEALVYSKVVISTDNEAICCFGSRDYPSERPVRAGMKIGMKYFVKCALSAVDEGESGTEYRAHCTPSLKHFRTRYQGKILPIAIADLQAYACFAISLCVILSCNKFLSRVSFRESSDAQYRWWWEDVKDHRSIGS